MRAVIALRPDDVTGVPPALDAGPGLPALYLEELADGQPAESLTGIRPPVARDLAAFVHTGGTTGTPKVAAHTHANQLACARGIAESSGLMPGVGVLAGLPLFHVNALIVTGIAPLYSGARVVWPGPAGYRDPALYQRFWKIVEHYQIAAMSAVPTVYGALTQVPVDANISSLTVPIVGAAPLPAAVRDGFARHTGNGLTEATCASTWNRPGADRPGSVGQALPGQQVKAVRVGASGSWQDCGPGEAGTLVIGGPAVFAGYVTDPLDGGPRVSRGATVRDGWLDTGDLGHVDADGYVYLTGRAKDLIIRGGHNIDPRVIEEALLGHPGVMAAAAVGQPDAHAGEVPVAYVVAADPGAFDEAGLLEWAASSIGESAARPKRIYANPAIPLTAVGKQFRPALAADATRRAVAAALEGAGVSAAEISVTAGEAGLTVSVTGAAPIQVQSALAGLPVTVRAASQRRDQPAGRSDHGEQQH
jgi:fatty-acyl-CoA synthase